MAIRAQGPQTTMQSAATGTANGTSLMLGNYAQATIQVTGTFSAEVTWEATVDGTNWVAVALADLNSTSRARGTSDTTAGLYLLEEAGGLQRLRARVSTFTSGSVTAVGVASA